VLARDEAQHEIKMLEDKLYLLQQRYSTEVRCERGRAREGERARWVETARARERERGREREVGVECIVIIRHSLRAHHSLPIKKKQLERSLQYSRLIVKPSITPSKDRGGVDGGGGGGGDRDGSHGGVMSLSDIGAGRRGHGGAAVLPDVQRVPAALADYLSVDVAGPGERDLNGGRPRALSHTDAADRYAINGARDMNGGGRNVKRGGVIGDGPEGAGGAGGATDTWVASRAAARPWSAGSPQVCLCEVTQGDSGQALCPTIHSYACVRARTHTQHARAHTHTTHTGWIHDTG
jgi:hypothetical protein